MKPVYQATECPIKGDCWAACIASILEMSLSDIPNFCVDDPVYWWRNTQKWMAERGLFIIETDWPCVELPDGHYVILTGPSTMFENSNHAVVGKIKVTSLETQQIDFIHDPNRHSKSQYIKEITHVAIIGKMLIQAHILNTSGRRCKYCNAEIGYLSTAGVTEKVGGVNGEFCSTVCADQWMDKNN